MMLYYAIFIIVYYSTLCYIIRCHIVSYYIISCPIDRARAHLRAGVRALSDSAQPRVCISDDGCLSTHILKYIPSSHKDISKYAIWSRC